MCEFRGDTNIQFITDFEYMDTFWLLPVSGASSKLTNELAETENGTQWTKSSLWGDSFGKCEYNNTLTLVKSCESLHISGLQNKKKMTCLISVTQIDEVSFVLKGTPAEIMLLSFTPLLVSVSF